MNNKSKITELLEGIDNALLYGMDRGNIRILDVITVPELEAQVHPLTRSTLMQYIDTVNKELA